MAQEHQQPVESSGASPRTQRMTAAESRAVIDLWQSEQVEQTGLTDRPAVPDVAEGLNITVEDVQRLLLEVRARRLEEERALMYEQELVKARLAEEERKLVDVQRQRLELRRHQKPRQLVPHSRWIEVRPGVWEDAGLPGYSCMDFNQLLPNSQEVDKQVHSPAMRFAATLAKVILLSLPLVLIIAYIFYVLWFSLTVPHR